MVAQILTLNNPNQDIAYLNSVVSLVERTNTTNASPHLYPQQRDFFEGNLRGNTINILALVGKKVIGYSALRKMNPWPDYIEPYAYLPEECALMLFNLVDPTYRGQGIGKQLSATRIDAAKSAGFRHLFVTVHPENMPSISILNSFGFKLIAQKPMFTSKLIRNLMYLYIGD